VPLGGLDDASEPSDASAVDASGPFAGEAPHRPLPQLVQLHGPLSAALRPVTVTFAGDPMAADLASFGASAANSAWWATVSSGFCNSSGTCVGAVAGTAVPLTLSAAPSYTDSIRGGASSLQDWLTAALAQGTLPAPDPAAPLNTIYLLYLPKTTTVSLDGVSSCVDTGFDGYHSTVAGSKVAYAVIDECDPVTATGSAPPLTVLQNTTITASHELVEDATDPISYTGFALDPADEQNWAWIDVTGGGEVGDLCVDPFALGQDETSEGAFTVQKMWSNAHAAQGIDPCVPGAPGEVYFNAAPAKSFFVLDVGQSVTFEVDAFASGAMADWVLGAQDWSTVSTKPTYLSLSIGGGRATDAGPALRVNNGSKVLVTATLLRDPSSLPTREADGALVSASFDAIGKPLAAHFWPFAVMSSTTAADAGLVLTDH
jgi:hypothetical protein